ncbi:MAG TPA: hypothetical protein VFK05_37380 [Polyangiaceae bacterium]|nr:hypothetical protein [Polyangiaceae bacterium]
MAIGQTTKVGVWGAQINGQFLIPSTNDPSVAVVTSKGSGGADGMIHNISVQGVREGNVMLEARLGPGGPVWAVTQVVVGKTAAVPAVAAASKVGTEAVAVARKELATGVFENEGNDNAGARVDEYERLFGLHNQPWCAMFVYFCYNTAAAKLGTSNPLPKIAGASALLVWAQRNDKLVTEPVAGDVLIVKPGTHVGLVTGTPRGGKVPSIEGNTWSHGTADNHRDGVYEKSRPVENCYYLRV